MSRGDHSENIFYDDEDRQLFLGTLQQCCQMTSWQIQPFSFGGGNPGGEPG
jgi:hypothetical protein